MDAVSLMLDPSMRERGSLQDRLLCFLKRGGGGGHKLFDNFFYLCLS